MATALIGHTGFVGETLKRQTTFDALFHSTDIEAIEGRHFDLVVCAGAPAAKWKANREPDADRANLDRLRGNLERVTADRFVLVSTVDVYPAPASVDEDTPIEPDPRNAYGKNRLALEHFCRKQFDATVVRLPALFGAGLRKNAVYDLLHENNVDQLQPLSTFQFFDMALLWQCIQMIEGSGVKVVNLATEPLSLGTLAEAVFGRTLAPSQRNPVANYDFRTRHAALWGRSDGYAYGARETLERMRSFVASFRVAGGSP